jgi:peptidoglycan/LPS O-acetylase OafA/YrhL
MHSVREPTRYAYIDSLRGLAILLVLLAHASQGQFAIDALTRYSPNSPPLALPRLLSEILSKAGYGVQLFFVVSSFSLTLSWLSRQKLGEVDLANYFFRRFFRIAPMFYIGIVFYTFFLGWGPRLMAPTGITFTDVMLTFTFLHVWHDNSINSVVPGGWSIGVEAMSYIMLPIVLGVTRSVRTILVFALVSIVGAYALQKPMLHTGVGTNLWYFTFPAQAAVFLFGIAAAIFITDKNHMLTSYKYPYSKQYLSCASLAVFIFMLVGVPLTGLPGQHLQFSACAALLCILLHNVSNGILVNPVLSRIGLVSFSIYLSHFALLAPCLHIARMLVGPESGGVGLLCVYYPLLVTLSFAVASLTYIGIEEPCIRLGKQTVVA